MPICFTSTEYRGDLGERLLNSRLLKFDEIRERGSSIVKRYYSTLKLRDFSFSICAITGKVIMKGSWAKFHNNGQHNHTPYSTSDLSTDIATLSDLFSYDFSGGLLHSIEAGVNLDLAGLPQPYFTADYLLPRVICYKGRKPFLPMKSIKGAGQGIECDTTNYRIKLYDKGTQYRLPNRLLRFEYDCNQMKEIRPIGIRYLIDLTDSGKMVLLGEKVQELIAAITMMEPLDTGRLLTAERKLYGNAERPSFWTGLSRANRSYYLQKFRELMEAYSQHRLHQNLCELVSHEWDTLTENSNIFPITDSSIIEPPKTKNSNIFLGTDLITPSAYQTGNYNIFLPVNSGKRYNWPDRIDEPVGEALTAPIEATGEATELTLLRNSPDEERRCEVTEILLDKAQPSTSKVVGITTLRNNPAVLALFRQRYGRKACKRDYHTEEYRLAHGPRNEKSNGPNNLRRKVMKSLDSVSLFKDCIKLTDGQHEVMMYFDGTPYEVKLRQP